MLAENDQATWVDSVVPRGLRDEARSIAERLETMTADVAHLCLRSTEVMGALDDHISRAYADVDRLVTDSTVEQEVEQSVRLFLSHVAGTARLHRSINALEHVLADVVRASTNGPHPLQLD